ncbi:MAG: mechanosensitive ion channel family protein [Ignavibacteria bacterium]|nr:mechanosensitive ion channel family protein [Ignavibacteria bacterium]
MENYLSTEYWSNLLNKAVDWLIQHAPSIIVLIILLFVSLKLFTFLIKRIKKIIIKKVEKSSLDKIESEKRINTLMSIICKTGRVTIWIIFLMMLLKTIGVDIAPILAGAGILGLAIGFGAQSLIKDVISGFFILLENQIRVGDIATINGITGTVEEIQLRTVILRDMTGVVHIFEAGKIDSLANITKEWSASILDIPIAYKENIDEVIKIMNDVADELYKDENHKDKFLAPFEIFGLEKFDESAIIIRARMKTVPHQQWALAREYRKRLKAVFDEKNIEIPFNHISLYWGEKSKPLRVEVIKK